MRYLISRQWSVLQEFDITGESGDLRSILPSTFEVDTADEEDDLFLLCPVLAIEQIHRERKRR